MSKAINLEYGAFELKKRYQKNMMLGNLSVVMLVSALLVFLWVYPLSSPAKVDITGGGEKILDSIIINLQPRPDFTIPRPKPGIYPGGNIKAKVGKPVIIPDDLEGEEETSLLNRSERFALVSGLPSGGGGGEGPFAGVPPVDGHIPSPDTFIPVEKLPVIIHQEPLVYPRLALEGGFPGKVVIEVYIDKKGDVKMAQVVKCNRPGIGFEEAAIEAAYKSKYRPAIQNNEPVGVWISYTVKFVLQ